MQAPVVVRSVVVTLSTIVTTGLGLAALPGSPAYAQQPPLACGTVLTASVTLGSDMHCAGDALTVGAAGLTINLAGHTITGDTTGTGIAANNVGSLTVRNGTIADFATGVALMRSPNARFDRVVFRGGTGLYLSGASDDAQLNAVALLDARVWVRASQRAAITRSVGRNAYVYYSESNGSSVSRSAFTDSTIYPWESDSFTISDSTLVRTPLWLDLARGSLVRHNRISGAGEAIVLGMVTLRNQIVDNTLTGNNVGVVINAEYADLVDQLVISGNTFRGNDTAGVLLNLRGVLAAPTMEVRDNRFVGNGVKPDGRTDYRGRPVADGLHIATPVGTMLTVAGNVARGNGAYGIYAEPGSVIDGGGNVSVHDPAGCLGVVCR